MNNPEVHFFTAVVILLQMMSMLAIAGKKGEIWRAAQFCQLHPDGSSFKQATHLK